jgi:MFS family permease
MSEALAKRLTLVACILASTIVFVDQTVVNGALPALRYDLDASLADQPWVIKFYLLALASLVLVGGSLGDLYGRRRIFVIGVTGFGAASLVCVRARPRSDRGQRARAPRSPSARRSAACSSTPSRGA